MVSKQLYIIDSSKFINTTKGVPLDPIPPISTRQMVPRLIRIRARKRRIRIAKKAGCMSFGCSLGMWMYGDACGGKHYASHAWSHPRHRSLLLTGQQHIIFYLFFLLCCSSSSIILCCIFFAFSAICHSSSSFGCR